MSPRTSDDPRAREAMEVGALRFVRAVLLSWTVLSVVLLALTTSQINGRAAEADCLTATPKSVCCLGGLEPSSVTLEFAGDGKRVACQLHIVAAEREQAPPTLSERICVEVRIEQRWDEVTRLDARILIPSYSVVSILLAAWVALRARVDAPGGTLGGSQFVGIAIVATTALLAGLDFMENRHTMSMLVAAERVPLVATLSRELDTAAAFVRAASLYKWLAAVLWGISLAWGIWCIRPEGRRVQRWARLLSVWAFFAAAAAIAGGVVYGATTDEIAGPVRAISTGFGLAILGMFAAAVMVFATRMERVCDLSPGACGDESAGKPTRVH